MSATVVIADDDADIRTLIEVAVKRAGHTVLASVTDGEQALAAVTTHRPELVVLDVSMPKLTGLQVCQRVRTDPRTAGSHILIISADAQPSAVQAGLAAGADAYLAKPFSLPGLRAQVDELLTKADH